MYTWRLETGWRLGKCQVKLAGQALDSSYQTREKYIEIIHNSSYIYIYHIWFSWYWLASRMTERDIWTTSATSYSCRPAEITINKDSLLEIAHFLGMILNNSAHWSPQGRVLAVFLLSGASNYSTILLTKVWSAYAPPWSTVHASAQEPQVFWGVQWYLTKCRGLSV